MAIQTSPLKSNRLKNMFPDCVVVIEHHAFQRAVLVKALGNLGVANVLSASDAEQAIGLLTQLPKVDIVFSTWPTVRSTTLRS